ncbi:MAG: glycosyltransferase family 1 protein [Lactobacillus sp.]|nr:MAG: glycosyltransferase family 1 protein [Lactobacillus sp.]
MSLHKKPVRVLQFPNSLNRRNGRMSVIMNVYRNLNRKEVQFDFVVPKTAYTDYSEEILQLGGRIYWLPENKSKNIYYIKKLIKQVLSNENYQIVHYHATSPWGMCIGIAKKMEIPNRITHSHNTRFSSSFFKTIRNKIFSYSIPKNSTLRLACSTEAGDFLFKRLSFQNIKNVIDINKFAFNKECRTKIRNELSIDEDTLLIGQVGRLAPEKNHKFSLKVAKKLVDKNIKFKLVLLGDGILDTTLKQKVTELGLEDRIVFLGQRNNMNEYYSAMDIGILPSLYEGLPMVAIEAQCAGLHVLMSDKITKESNIGLGSFLNINDDNVNEWCDSIGHVWKSSKNSTFSERKKIGITMAGAAGYDAKIESKKWENLYRNLVK